jgi:glycosyltransferase involved in cell wall biosynthesis
MDLLDHTQIRTIPVSVVVPAFNRVDLLAAALGSVRAQTAQPEELLVVDDGSEDSAAIERVAQEYGARLIRQENAGPSAARNTGLASARCDWLAFLDSDDTWLPRKLDLQWGALSLVPECGGVISNFRPVTSQGSFDQTAFEVNAPYKTIEKRWIAQDAYELLTPSAGHALARSMFVQPSGLLLRRDVALSIGGFDVRMKRCEDHDFALRLFAATRVLAVENAVVRYRVHAESLSRNEVDMRLGELELAGRVLAHPERYPPGADAVVAQVLPSWVRKAAASFVKRGDTPAARRLLRSVIRSDRSPRTLTMYVATCLVPGLPKRYAHLILELWRRRPWRRVEAWNDGPPSLVTEMRLARSDGE